MNEGQDYWSYCKRNPKGTKVIIDEETGLAYLVEDVMSDE